jgi:hypothetical protein
VVPLVGHPQQGRRVQQLGKEGVILFCMTENQDSSIIIIIVEKRKPKHWQRGPSELLSFRFDSWHWL